MQFHIKGQTHFLSFIPSEGRWFMYAPTPDGMQRIPVEDDAHVHFDKFVLPPMEDPTVM